MQFITNGPDVPDTLLRAHEDGKVVFFAGAGVSRRAGLPDFPGLVDQLFIELNETPTPVQREAIEKHQFDTAIDLLERSVVGERMTVRRKLVNILTPNLTPSATSTHEALLTLSTTRGGLRHLITTNFDRIFEEVIRDKRLAVPRFRAPLLPMPKRRWDGLVYLHGRITNNPSDDDLAQLVLSSGDFGLAYLTDRWAARFVSELFRRYVICYVGYGINDSVLRYMMDALAADRRLGESSLQTFAFAGYSQTAAHERDRWEAKNVIPILYRDDDAHILLHQTLQEWASTYRDGTYGKERIVVDHAASRPIDSTQEDDFVGRMLWSLSDRGGRPARRFAEHDPVPPLEWLKPFSDRRFRPKHLPLFEIASSAPEDESLTFSLVERPSPYSHSPWMAFVQPTPSYGRLDERMYQLARWLTRHLDSSELLLWLVRRGSQPHWSFANLIRERLKFLDDLARSGDTDRLPSPLMRSLWELFLLGRLRRRRSHSAVDVDILRWLTRAKDPNPTKALCLELRNMLTPYVSLERPLFLSHALSNDRTNADTHGDPVDWKIVLPLHNAHHWLGSLLEDDPNFHHVLSEMVRDFTALLRDALDLKRELGRADDKTDNSYFDQPSIASHPQNNDWDDWTVLIGLTRDAWLATAARMPQRARDITEEWISIPYPLFRRLAYFAATHTTVVPPEHGLKWLLADQGWWLWSPETQREAIRLLVALSEHLALPERRRLEQAILDGPPPAMGHDDDRAQYKTWFRLAKLQKATSSLSDQAQAKLDELATAYPSWTLADDEHDEFPFWTSPASVVVDAEPSVSFPSERSELVAWFKRNSSAKNFPKNHWRERCQDEPTTTARALTDLAADDEWLPHVWSVALQSWTEDGLARESWRILSTTVVGMPTGVLQSLQYEAGRWLQSIAKSADVDNNTAENDSLGDLDLFDDLCHRIVRLPQATDDHEDDNDPVFRAVNHTIGHVTEALLRRCYHGSPVDGQGLPDKPRAIFTELCDTEIVRYRHGRVWLAVYVIALFRVDMEWTTEHVLPRFDWAMSRDEARASWMGFLWSPRLYHPLMKAIKASFLDTAGEYDTLGRSAEQFAGFLTIVALNRGSTFSDQELKEATASLPEEGLRRAAWTLVQVLDSVEGQHTEYWRNRMQPYFEAIWPRSLDKHTPAISERIALLCIAAGEAFPEAFEYLRSWLQPLGQRGGVTHRLLKSNLCKQFPAATLVFLSIVIGENPRYVPHRLAECLQQIGETDPALLEDPMFRRLSDYT